MKSLGGHHAAAPTPTALPAAQRFGPGGRFELRAHERQLRVDGQAAAIGARAFDLLLALVDQPGLLLTKHALMERIWSGLVVQENNLAAQVSALRKVLGDELIATIPGRGYRFTGRPVALGASSLYTPAFASASAPATALAAVTPADAAPGHTAPRTNLPERPTRLLGRDDDLAALGALVPAHRLVTLVGAGGIGKTRLAQAFLLAQRGVWPHGVCWVELATLSDPLALPETIATALGVRLGTGEPLAGLCAAVAPLGMLVALDNAELLLPAVARVALALLEHAPGLCLLVTSQAPLKLAVERVFRLDALAVPSGPLPAAQALDFGAVALFAERAQAADRHFALTDANAPAVIELCRALDGLALAIELAAARVPTLGMQRLLSSLQDRLKLLTRPHDRAAPARQQTLRATLEWSHGLLGEREQTVFRRLGVVAGSASLDFILQMLVDGTRADEAHAAGLDEWAVLDALAVLVERSLVNLLADDDDAAGPRYRLLESSRLFALECLQAAGEREACRRRHAMALSKQFDTQWDQRHGGRIGMEAWELLIARDAANATDAIAWATQAGLSDIVLTIATTWLLAMSTSRHAERMALADACAALCSPRQPPRLQLRVALMLARTWTNSRKPEGWAAAGQALALARALDAAAPDHWPLYRALAQWVESASGVDATDPAALTQAMAELQALEDPAWPPHRLYAGLGAAVLFLSRQDTGLALADEVLATARRTVTTSRAAGEDPSAQLGNLMDAELRAGDAPAAIRTGRTLLARLDGSRQECSAAYARLNLGAALLSVSDAAQAEAVLRAGWSQALVFDLQPYFADYLALLAALQGRPQTAARLAGYADAANLAVGSQREGNEAAAIERARALASAALGEKLFEQLQGEGRDLRGTQIASLVFGDADAPALTA